MQRIASLIATLAIALAAGAQTHLPMTEKLEWTWTDRPVAPVVGLPYVLLVGDSITRGYYPAVAKQLSGVANVYLFTTSASSGDPRLVPQLRDYFSMMGLQFTVIHFNVGIHGLGYTEQQYAAGLPDVIAALRAGAPRVTLVWASCTSPFPDPTKTDSTNARLEERNRLAAALMAHEGIAIDDQHALMAQHNDLHAPDHLHFTEAGSALQAAQAADSIRRALHIAP